MFTDMTCPGQAELHPREREPGEPGDAAGDGQHGQRLRVSGQRGQPGGPARALHGRAGEGQVGPRPHCGGIYL